ncbi:MAG: ATP-grasp domain-containing protein [Bacteroidota bacterium]
MSRRDALTWVLEAEVFPASHAAMRDAVVARGHEVVLWTDEWVWGARWPRLDGPVVFHGSLGNADFVARSSLWRPGAFCNTEAFRCTAWYPAAQPWLLHETWVSTTVAAFVASPAAVFDALDADAAVFVRPDSPLKPFSGRALRRDAVSLDALDHGFYYDDDALPIIVAPIRNVEREWRYVVVDGHVVAGSAYAADGRTALPDDPNGAPWAFAAKVAKALPLPDPVTVLDVCACDGRLRLLELNPFSGADLYACDRTGVVRAVSAVVARSA